MFFKKKELPRCPICGEEIKGLKKMTIMDGDICASCYLKVKPVVEDKIFDMTVQQVKDVMDGKPVEVADMGIPEACPVCGRPMPEYPTRVKDGYICEECDRLMRGNYSKKTTYTYDKDRDQERGNSLKNYDSHTEDELEELTVSYIRQLVEIEKDSRQEYLDEYGDQYENIFGVDEGFDYDLGAFEGGIRNAGKLKDKMVVKGCIEKGEFSDGDEVFFIQNDHKAAVKILAAVPCTGKDFGLEISTRLGKTTISAHSYGWLVLDLDLAEVTGDDVIVS